MIPCSPYGNCQNLSTWKDYMQKAMIPSLKLTVPPWWLGDYFPFGKAMLGLCWFLGRVVTVFLADHRCSSIVFYHGKRISKDTTPRVQSSISGCHLHVWCTQIIYRPKIPTIQGQSLKDRPSLRKIFAFENYSLDVDRYNVLRRNVPTKRTKRTSQKKKDSKKNIFEIIWKYLQYVRNAWKVYTGLCTYLNLLI